jgi:integrase
VVGWSVSTSTLCIPWQRRSSKALRPFSGDMCGWVFCAKNWQLLNAGASLEVVKELMGHRSLDVTLRYTQLYDRTKRAQYDQAMLQVAKRQGLHGR